MKKINRDIFREVSECISTSSPSWLDDARKLMEKKKVFVVVGWQWGFDQEEFSKSLATEMDYELFIQHEKNRACFRPRVDGRR